MRPHGGGGAGKGGRPDQERVAYLDVLRVVAVAAVVTLHTANSVLHESAFNGAAWWFGNIASSSLRWSVPVFLMISGTLLLDGSRRVAPAPRMVRIAVPAAFWSCVYLAAEYSERGLTPKLLVWKIAYGQAHYHLWYLFMLLGMCAVLLPLRKLCLACDRRELFAVLAALFPLQWIYYLDVSRATVATNSVAPPLFALQFIPYVPYVLLGHYLGRYESAAGARRRGWLLLGLLLAMISGTQWYLSQELGSFLASTIAHSNFSPLIFGSAIVVYMKAKRMDPVRLGPGLLRACHAAASVSLGIYAIHPLFLSFLRRLLGEFGPFLFHGLGILPVATAAFFGSLAASLAMSRIPMLRRCVT